MESKLTTLIKGLRQYQNFRNFQIECLGDESQLKTMDKLIQSIESNLFSTDEDLKKAFEFLKAEIFQGCDTEDVYLNFFTIFSEVTEYILIISSQEESMQNDLRRIRKLLIIEIEKTHLENKKHLKLEKSRQLEEWIEKMKGKIIGKN